MKIVLAVLAFAGWCLYLGGTKALLIIAGSLLGWCLVGWAIGYILLRQGGRQDIEFGDVILFPLQLAMLPIALLADLWQKLKR